MTSINKEIINEDGSKKIIEISTSDTKTVNAKGRMVIANHKQKKESEFTKKYKNSILGTDIGVKSAGFTSVTILAAVVALTAVAVMYFMWRY